MVLLSILSGDDRVDSFRVLILIKATCMDCQKKKKDVFF